MMVLQREGEKETGDVGWLQAETGTAIIGEPSLQVGGNHIEWKTAILGQQLETRRRIEEVKGELSSELICVFSNFSCQLRNIYSAVKRIVIHSVICAVWTSSSATRERERERER